MRIIAPGKLIISGEHSILYAQPALLTTIDRYMQVNAEALRVKLIILKIEQFNFHSTFTFDEIKKEAQLICKRYENYCKGKLDIKEVCLKPIDLLISTIGFVLSNYENTLPYGLEISFTSHLFLGSGMGSSAAVILCLLKLFNESFSLQLTKEKLLKIAQHIENLQHGRSSGIDLTVIHEGGSFFIDTDRKLHSRKITNLPSFMIHTGTPDSTTGECVASVAKFFKEPSTASADFCAATKMIDDALDGNNLSKLKEGFRYNHRLLSKIQVVPEKVNRFIAKIESIAGAAKICGAGSIRGDRGGIVLAIAEDRNQLENIVNEYAYTLSDIKYTDRGLHVSS